MCIRDSDRTVAEIRSGVVRESDEFSGFAGRHGVAEALEFVTNDVFEGAFQLLSLIHI